MVFLVSFFPICFDRYLLAFFVDPVGDSCLKSVLRARSPVGLFLGLWVIVLLHLGSPPSLGGLPLVGDHPRISLGCLPSVEGFLLDVHPPRVGPVGPPLLRVSSLLGVPRVFSLGFVYQAFDVSRRFFS